MSVEVNNKINIKNLIKWFICIALPIILLLIPETEVYNHTIKIYMALTICAIAIWATEIMDYFIPVLILPVLYVVFGVASSSQVYSSWGVSTTWVIFGGMLLCKVFEDTGLMKRIAYWCIIKTGGSYRGILIGLMLSGFLMALLIPTVSGRVALYAALTYGLCVALELKPGSSMAAGIMIGGFFAASYTAYLYSTGSNIVLIGLNSLSVYGYDVTFADFMLQNAPVTIISCLLMALGLSFVMKQDSELKGKDFFREQYLALGKMSSQEKKFMIILIVTVLMLATNSLHHIDAAWVFTVAAAICYVPNLNIADINSMRKINFSMLFFITTCLSIGTCAKVCGASTLVGDLIGPYLTLGGKMYTVTAVWVASFLLNLLMTPMAAISSMTNPFIEIAIANGINPIGIVYIFIQGLDQFIFPYEVAPALLMFAYGMVNMRQFMKVFAIKAVYNLVFIIIVCTPYWKILGIL